MIYHLFIYLLIFGITCFDLKFPDMQKLSIKNYFKYENKNKRIIIEKFIMQAESHQQDILLMNNSHKLEFNVYHKDYSKNDYIHFIQTIGIK